MEFTVDADFKQASRALKKRGKDLRSSVKKALLNKEIKKNRNYRG